jgi:protocatechuate 3,4-dioxygenase beta subunit
MAIRSSKSRREVLGGLASGVATMATMPIGLAGAIRRTPSQTRGPFYPMTKPVDQDADLTVIAGRSGKAQGQVIYISGRVLGSHGKPLAGARIEIWQANTHGRYTHPGDTNPAPLDPNFDGFARFTTDAHGRYAFKSIKPGGYPQGVSGPMRPPHIHFEVQGPGNRLATQLYFAGESLNEGDRLLASEGVNRDALIVKLAPSGSDLDPGSLSGNWDIVLADG